MHPGAGDKGDELASGFDRHELGEPHAVQESRRCETCPPRSRPARGRSHGHGRPNAGTSSRCARSLPIHEPASPARAARCRDA
jgi:hypothetical protein